MPTEQYTYRKYYVNTFMDNGFENVKNHFYKCWIKNNNNKVLYFHPFFIHRLTTY